MTIAAGTRFDTYEVTALLGRGGMGEVYRARDTKLRRDVAVKVLGPRLVGNADAVARFEQEARSASALSHPHILHIYDIGAAEVPQSGGGNESLRYIVMELVDGVTLTDRIADDSADSGQLLEWLAQVADGLAKAHDAGIVHRDLKPDNVMVSRDGYAKILDFGLAKLVETRMLSHDASTMAGANPLSTPGMILGTASYMSPEQAQGKAVDSRTDIFAFGCMIFEAVTRRRAFEGSSVVDTLHRIIHSEPDLAPLDERLARVVRKCLAKNAERRYQSIRDVALDLREIVHDLARHGERAAALVSAAGRDATARTIAVLPFDDLSPGHDNEYFADGLAEEITSDLSKIGSLRVLSRASLRRFRGEKKDVGRVGVELGADYVIDGSVRKAGNHLRITAELIDARSLTQIWSERYNGTMADVFDFQESVAHSVVVQLRVKLTSSEHDALGRRSMSNVDAWECYLRARRLFWRFDEAGLTAALDEIEKGLAIAGPNAAILGVRGMVYWQYYNLGIRPDPIYLDRAEAIARTILEAEPDSPYGLRLAGLVAIQRQQLRMSIDYFERVLSQDPNDVDALLWITSAGQMTGRDVRAHAERLMAVDPLNPFTWIVRSHGFFLAGQFDSAIDCITRARAIEAVPIFLPLHAQYLLVAGRREEALAMIPELEQSDDPMFAPLARAMVLAAAGQKERACKLLTEEILQASRGDLMYSSWIAEIYAQVGEKALALDWLGNAIHRGYVVWPFFSEHDRLLDAVRDEPGFAALMEMCRAEWGDGTST